MLFSMVVSLFTTRVVLDTLGASDYGISNLVGGVVGMMSIVTSLLSQGTTRFITLSLGKNNQEELKNTFSASITIHLILSGIILILGEIIGPVVVGRLNISADRMGAAQFVFQISLMSSILGIVQSPFHASIIAHEKMSVYAYISIWDVIAKLCIVFLLTSIKIDKLKLYSLLFGVVCLITTIIYVLYCRKHFEECRRVIIRPDKKLYKEIFNYTGWNAIGSLAFTMNNQGVTILLNAFGTSVNAARGIADSVSGIVYRFVDSFQAAAKPQIVKLYAIQDYDAMNNLIVRVSKFSSYLMGVMGIPLFLEMDYILQLWLKDVPEYTVVFARLTLIQGLVQSMDFPIGAGIHAVGKMKLPNITSALIYMMILPMGYFAIKLGCSPKVVYILAICAYPLAMCMDLYIIHKYTGFKAFRFIKEVVAKSFVFILITGLITHVISGLYFKDSLIYILVQVLLSTCIFIPLVYLLGLTHSERLFIKNSILQKIHNIYE